jgi:hypothetical protein
MNNEITVASASGEQRILAILGPRAIVGELPMIDGLPRSASVDPHADVDHGLPERMYRPLDPCRLGELHE